MAYACHVEKKRWGFGLLTRLLLTYFGLPGTDCPTNQLLGISYEAFDKATYAERETLVKKLFF